MRQGLTSKVSFSNWVLGGPLVTVTKNDIPEPRARGARRVVITEVDSDGNEIDKHIVPLTKHKKKVVKLSSVKTGSEPDVTENKETPVQSEKSSVRSETAPGGRFCNFCGQKREDCVVKNCYSTSHLLPKEEPKIEPTVSKNVFGGSQTGEAKWTDVQDDIIQDMKRENRPWKEIAEVVGASKKDVQNRFKALNAMKQGDEQARNNTKPSTANGLGISDIDVPAFDFTRLLLDEENGVDRGVSSNDAPFSTLTGYDGYGGDKKSKEDKKKKHWADKEDNSSDWFKISPPGLSPTGISPVGSFDMPPIPKPPPRYSQPFVQSDSPPPQVGHFTRANMGTRLRPDLIWTAEDCGLLEDLENNYTRNKWLHMQADFFNWSGRMVDASIIERKFKENGFH